MVSYKFIDLTHTLWDGMPTWNNDPSFKQEIVMNYDEFDGKCKFCITKFDMYAGIGTHIDAPRHCIQNARSLEEIKLDELFMQCHVINTSSKCNETYIVTANDIHEYENTYGTITAKSCVMLYTGWSKYWGSPAEYHNHHKYPSISIDAVQILLDRGVFAIGIDTMSPDRMVDDFPVHRMWLGADKILIENVANLDQMPVVGSHIIAFPLKIKDAVEFPVRVVGMVAQ